jgi:hypothetical protein
MNNWVENSLNLALAGTAWIVSNFLSQQKIIPFRTPFGHLHVKQKKNIGGMNQVSSMQG